MFRNAILAHQLWCTPQATWFSAQHTLKKKCTISVSCDMSIGALFWVGCKYFFSLMRSREDVLYRPWRFIFRLLATSVAIITQHKLNKLFAIPATTTHPSETHKCAAGPLGKHSTEYKKNAMNYQHPNMSVPLFFTTWHPVFFPLVASTKIRDTSETLKKIIRLVTTEHMILRITKTRRTPKQFL